MTLRLTGTGIAAIALFYCTCLCSLPAYAAAEVSANTPAGAQAEAFSYEKAKRAITDYLTSKQNKKPLFTGYRMLSDTKVEVYYTIRGYNSGPMTILLLNTGSGMQWFVITSIHIPLK
jgi:hypothetical protein